MYQFREGDVVVLKKQHPCGNDKWQILKNGVDVTIQCTRCLRIIKMRRIDFNKQIKSIENVGEQFEK